MKVYVITDGCYSDYEICGVSLDKGKAEKIRKYLHADSVEEYETDRFDAIADGKKFFSVTLNEIGNPNKIEEDTPCSWCATEQPIFDFCDGRKYRKWFYGRYILTDSREKAVKIAQDKRAEMLAEMNGIKA